MTEDLASRLMRVDKIRALETLCMGLPDCDKHFLAKRLQMYGSAGAGVEPLTNEDFCLSPIAA